MITGHSIARLLAIQKLLNKMFSGSAIGVQKAETGSLTNCFFKGSTVTL